MSLNSYQLKYIALITMIIDHVAIVFKQSMPDSVYVTMRSVGRLAFPIFCFLLVEGFTHTRNRKKYITRLLLFSLISEIPFDLVKYGKIIDWSGQNVFFTLSLGFIAMMFLEHFSSRKNIFYCAIILFPCLAEFIRSDYGSIGVVTIMLLYLYKKYERVPLWCCMVPLLVITIVSWMQIFCIFSLYFIQAYNGERGHGIKYLFYVVYPAHLLILYGLHSLL